MNASDRIKDFIRGFESCRLTAYPDPGSLDGKPWTIGWGTTRGVYKGMTITQEEADLLFDEDVNAVAKQVSRMVRVPLNQSQFDALVSFVYNVGAEAFRKSTLLRKLNAGNYDAVPGELARWNKVKGKVVRGLVNRRAAEAGLWARDAHVAGNMVEAATPRGSVAPVAVGGAGAVAGAGILATAGEHASPILAAIGAMDWKLAAVLAVACVAAFVAWRFCARDGSL